MKNIIIILLVAMLTIGMAEAGTWSITTISDDMIDHFEGAVESGTCQYGFDNTKTDIWYGNEIASISKKATWTNGVVFDNTQYEVPGVAGEAKFGTATMQNMIDTDGTGTFNVNTKTNFAGASMGGGAYPTGNFPWAGYGVELSATGDYALGTAIYETTTPLLSNSFDYFMAGTGSGKIRYGASSFGAGANWGDGQGSVFLNKWEYNSAEATGAGMFVETLHGDDYLQNAKYTLPNGGTVVSTATFTNGMSATPVWMYSN